MSTVTKGGDLMLFVGGKSIAFATSHTLTINAETKETSSKDSGGKWQTSEVGIISWSGKSENLYSTNGEGLGYAELFDKMVGREAIDAVFTCEASSLPDTNNIVTKLDAPDATNKTWVAGAASAANPQYKGLIIITSLELNAPNGDNATFTVNFNGNGALTKVTAAA